MPENDSQDVLSDAEILAIADANMSKGTQGRGGPMAHRLHFAQQDQSLVGTGVVHRDLPYLSSVKRYEDEPKKTDEIPEDERSGRSQRRIRFTSKNTYPRISTQWFGICMAGYDEAKRDEFVEVHYGPAEAATVVILRHSQVILTIAPSPGLNPPPF